MAIHSLTYKKKTPINGVANIVKRAAAIFIQKKVRAMQARKRVAKMKNVRNTAKKWAATKIQRAFRGRTYDFRPLKKRNRYMRPTHVIGNVRGNRDPGGLFLHRRPNYQPNRDRNAELAYFF